MLVKGVMRALRLHLERLHLVFRKLCRALFLFVKVLSDLFAGLKSVNVGHVNIQDDGSVVSLWVALNFLHGFKAVLSCIDHRKVGLKSHLE